MKTKQSVTWPRLRNKITASWKGKGYDNDLLVGEETFVAKLYWEIRIFILEKVFSMKIEVHFQLRGWVTIFSLYKLHLTLSCKIAVNPIYIDLMVM